jgi:hypothetical protein
LKRRPLNPSLWKRIQKLVSGKSSFITVNEKRYDGPNNGTGFKKHPSAYSNGWACKLYKKLGGKWENVKTAHLKIASRIAGLDKWFKEENWVAIDTTGNIIGECAQSANRPKETKKGQDPLLCMPKKKAERLPKEERAKWAKKKKRTEKTAPNTREPVHSRRKDRE